MMIKITTHCSMGCKHCFNAAKPDNNHMSFETLKDTMEFVKRQGIDTQLVITGGEPTEHPEFVKFMEYMIDFIVKNDIKLILTVTTNGFWIVDHPEEAKRLTELGTDTQFIAFQISADVRYYPKRLPTHKRIFRELKHSMVVDDCVQHIYRIGRAEENDIPMSDKYFAPRCVNAISVANQLYYHKFMAHDKLFSEANKLMTKSKLFCNIHIRPNGDIAFGESDLCPKVSSIYRSDYDIGADMLKHDCSKCDKNLAETKNMSFKIIPE